MRTITHVFIAGSREATAHKRGYTIVVGATRTG